MRLKTVWTLRGMSLQERLRRTEECFWRWAGARLPRKLAYWSYIHTGVRAMNNTDVVPLLRYTEVLERITK